MSIFHNFEAILRPVSEIEKLATHLAVGVLRFGVLFKKKEKNEMVLQAAHFSLKKKYINNKKANKHMNKKLK